MANTFSLYPNQYVYFERRMEELQRQISMSARRYLEYEKTNCDPEQREILLDKEWVAQEL